MRYTPRIVTTVALASILGWAASPDTRPKWPDAHVREVAPADAQPGEILCAHGENLDAAHIAAMYLTDGEADYKLEILEQATHQVRFRLPQWMPAGRMRVVILDEERRMRPQPAWVYIRSPWLPSGA
jgi:hypothetical protein